MTNLTTFQRHHAGVSPSTSSSDAADTRGFRSSGQSPGTKSIHLVGPGHVGRRFLELLTGQPYRLVAVSDRSGTVYDKAGLDAASIAEHKAAGGRIVQLPRAEAVTTEVALSVTAADIVVDATPSDAADTAQAVARGRAALRSGARLLLAAKNALSAVSAEWLVEAAAGRVGINAALGGAGAQLVRELHELRAHCRGLAVCGNVTTTVIVEAIERGASVEEGIAHAGRLGLLETDPTLDLDGSDAAVKLAAVWGAVFGLQAGAPRAVALTDIVRQDVRQLDPALLRQRAARGATTRLIGRGDSAAKLRVQFEEVPRSSPLCAPPDRVVYGFELAQGLRVHTGFGVGFEGTAAALLQDLTVVEVRR